MKTNQQSLEMAAISPSAPLTKNGSPIRRLSTFLFQHPGLVLLLLLAAPLLWLGVVYLGALGALLLQSFYRLDDFSGRVVREFTLATYAQLFSQANLDIVIRTVGMAAAVTIACALLAFPISFYMARYASPVGKVAFFI